MIDAGIVQGSAEMAVPVYYGKDRIDVHTDIHEVELPEEMGGGTIWEYHEYQYGVSEFMEVMMNNINGTEDAVCELSETTEESIAALEQAICDLSEEIGGGY